MNHSRSLALVLVFIAALTALPALVTAQCLPEDSPCTQNGTPSVLVRFQEPVTIDTANVTRLGSLAPFGLFTEGRTSSITTGQGVFTRYLVAALQRIANGEYTLTTVVRDAAANTASYTYTFRLRALGQRITLRSPANGGTQTQEFDFSIGTEFISECGWILGTTLYDDQESFEGRLNTFPYIDNGLIHTVEDFLDAIDRELVADETVPISVTCRHTLDGNIIYTPVQFSVTYHEGPPTISVSNSPDPIIDPYDPTTTLSVSGNQDVWCERIPLPPGTPSSYGGYADFGVRSYENYGRTITATYADRVADREPYRNLTLRCYNRAGFMTEANHTVFINYDDSIAITFTSPAVTRDEQYALTFTTNKLANCSALRGTNTLGLDNNQGYAVSFRSPNVTLSGISTTFSVSCFTRFSQDPVTATHVVQRDSDAPTLSSIITEPNTCSLNRIRFRLNATDGENGTGIALIEYSIRNVSGNGVLLSPRNVSANDDLVVESETVRLTNNSLVRITARVFDRAGNPSAPRTQDTRATTAELDSCDTTPPLVSVRENRTAARTDVFIVCVDDQSGCDDRYHYALKPVNTTGACVVNASGLGVALDTRVAVTQESMFCYVVSDNNGNTVNGQRRISVNTSSKYAPPTPPPLNGTCTDGKLNQDETDIDCGGSACGDLARLLCADGKKCDTDVDCASNSCVAGICAGASCTNDKQDGTESDVDCGGTCPACSLGDRCFNNADCTPGLLCTNRFCSEPPEYEEPLPLETGGGSNLLKLIIILVGSLFTLGGVGYSVLYAPPKQERQNPQAPVDLNEPLARFRPRGQEHGDDLTSEHPEDTPEARERRRKIRERLRDERASTIRTFESPDDLAELEHVTHSDVEQAFKDLDHEEAKDAVQDLIESEKITPKDVTVALKDLESHGHLEKDAITDLRREFNIEGEPLPPPVATETKEAAPQRKTASAKPRTKKKKKGGKS